MSETVRRGTVVVMTLAEQIQGEVRRVEVAITKLIANLKLGIGIFVHGVLVTGVINGPQRNYTAPLDVSLSISLPPKKDAQNNH